MDRPPTPDTYIKANLSPAYTNRFRVAGAKLTIVGPDQRVDGKLADFAILSKDPTAVEPGTSSPERHIQASRDTSSL